MSLNYENIKKSKKMANRNFSPGNDVENCEKSVETLSIFFELLGYTQDYIRALSLESISVLGESQNEEDLLQYYAIIKERGQEAFAIIRQIKPEVDMSTDIKEFEKAILGFEESVDNYILTNGYIYKVYENKPDGINMVNLKEVLSFSLLDDEEEDFKKFVGKYSRESVDGLVDFSVKQEDEMDEDELEDEEESKDSKDKDSNIIDKIKEKFSEDTELMKKIVLIIAGLVVVFLVLTFLTSGTTEGEKTITDTSTNTMSTNSNGETVSTVDLSADRIDSEASIIISSIIDLSVSASEELKIEMISNLDENAIIKLGVFCGENSSYIYSKTNVNGELIEKFDIPDTWGDEKIIVGAYLKFDEEQKQPSNITDKFGLNGEYIIWNPDLSKDMISYGEVIHSNALVESLKAKKEAEKERELQESAKVDFENIDIRVDAFGNMKQIPKGYDFDESNIAENVNIYPMIYYDASTKTSKLYVICGYVGTQFVLFDKVGFSCDGYTWEYENSTNEKNSQVYANKKSEWIYFNSVDTPELISDMSLVAASSEAQMYLTGTLGQTYTISKDSQNILKQFLYVYETYYGNGAYIPKTSWFEDTKTSVSLNYMKPSEMRQRGGSEVESMKTLIKKINDDSIEGIISEEDMNLYNVMKKTYREVGSDAYDIVYNTFNKEAELIFYDDYDSGRTYFRVYFFYDNPGEIKDGYPPYATFYDDGAVIVPIAKITSETTENDLVYARYYIEEETYENLENYFNEKNYVSFE